MKKMLSLFVLISACFASAQSYSLFPNNGAYYNITVMHKAGNGTDFIYDEEIIEFHPYNGSFDSSLIIKNENDTVGFLKQNGNQVLFKRGPQGYSNAYAGFRLDLSNDWEVLYDYSLMPGDSVYEAHGTVYVDRIETVSINGELRKAIYMDQADEVWIEGIGSSRHPLTTILYYFENNFWVNCSENNFEDQSSVSSHQTGPANCQSLGLVEEDHVNLKVYPNPIQHGGIINIEGTEKIKSIRMYNMQGGEVLLSKQNDTSFEIPFSLSPGVYLLAIDMSSSRVLKKINVTGK